MMYYSCSDNHIARDNSKYFEEEYKHEYIGKKCKITNKDSINYGCIGTIKKQNHSGVFMVDFDDGFSFHDLWEMEIKNNC